MAKAVVRVPLLAPGPAPERLPAEPGDPATRLRLKVADDGRSNRLLIFQHVATPAPAEGVAELLRVPNRPDLYPNDGIRLRLPSGETLTPTAQDIRNIPVTGGARIVPVDPLSVPGERIAVWAVTLSDDGIPSLPGGPWRVTFPRPPLAPPSLSVSATPAGLEFTWTAADPEIVTIAIEASAAAGGFERISPLQSRSTTQFNYRPPVQPQQYRAAGRARDGRTTTSNVVTA